MEIIFIILILFLISFVIGINFYFLTGKKISLKESFSLVTTASALNKLLFTGSGYLASSYFSRNKSLPFHKALSAFLLLEALGVSLWLGLGIYFGAKLVLKVPHIFVIILVLFLPIIWFQRQRFTKQAKNIFVAFKDMGRRVPLIAPFIVLNMILSVCYYFFLFKFFNFYPQVLTIIKIISVSFSVGYLSPAPAGLGFKDAGLVFLLEKEGLPLSVAFSIAIWDRIITTGFWAILGSFSGFDLIKEEIKKRWEKVRKGGEINLLF